MSDVYIIAHAERGQGNCRRLVQIDPDKWSTLPETDPELGISRAGWSLGSSATNEQWKLFLAGWRRC